MGERNGVLFFRKVDEEMKNKIFALALALVMVLSLAACTNNGGDKDNDNGGTNTPSPTGGGNNSQGGTGREKDTCIVDNCPHDGYGEYTEIFGATVSTINAYIYEGEWKNCAPNGQGTVTITHVEPTERLENRRYNSSRVLTGTFVDGYAHGGVRLVENYYYERPTETFTFSVHMGTAPVSEVLSASRTFTLRFDRYWWNTSLFGMTPWIRTPSESTPELPLQRLVISTSTFESTYMLYLAMPNTGDFKLDVSVNGNKLDLNNAPVIESDSYGVTARLTYRDLGVTVSTIGINYSDCEGRSYSEEYTLADITIWTQSEAEAWYAGIRADSEKYALAPVTATLNADGTINFPNKNIERAAKQALGLPVDVVLDNNIGITPSDAAKVTELSIAHSTTNEQDGSHPIHSLAGLEYFTALEKLTIHVNGNIYNISPMDFNNIKTSCDLP